jgi:hypothetical protein
LPGDDELLADTMSITPDHRIKVSITTRVRTEAGERAVRVVALSAKTALLYSPESVGAVGQCVDLLLTGIEREFEVRAGIERVESVFEGYASTVRFIVTDAEQRRRLNELLTLLLAGSGGGARKHPRILYEASLAVGQYGQGMLEELSLSGLSMRIPRQLANDAELTIAIPHILHRAPVLVAGRVTNQRPSPDGSYHTGVAFHPLSAERRMALSALLVDLMWR